MVLSAPLNKRYLADDIFRLQNTLSSKKPNGAPKIGLLELSSQQAGLHQHGQRSTVQAMR